jgi:hypothetical protein
MRVVQQLERFSGFSNTALLQTLSSVAKYTRSQQKKQMKN